MQSSRSAARGVWRAAAANSWSSASTSAQAVAIIPRRLVAPLSTTSSSQSSFFSTSSWLGQQTEKSKKAEETKLADKEVGGEVMGATEKTDTTGKAEGSGAASVATEELQKTIKEKDVRIKELSDAVLYGKADMQNMQRRSLEEKAQASDYAITKFARDLTSSLDVLALALKSVPESLRTKPKDATEAEDPRKAVSELYSGVELTSKSMLDMLRRHGVTTFDPTGEKFNPQEHEAMYQAPVPGKEPGTVLECSKLGFKIKDRILRAAQVGVVQDS